MLVIKNKRFKREVIKELMRTGLRATTISKWGDQRIIGEFADHVIADSCPRMAGNISLEYDLYDVLRLALIDRYCKEK